MAKKIILNLSVIPAIFLLYNIQSKPISLLICFLFILIINSVNKEE